MNAVAHVLSSGLVDVSDVARVVGATPRSVSRWQADEVIPRREAEERILELGAVLDMACRIMPESSARLWLRSPISDLDWQKPLDVIHAGGFKLVIDSLEALAEGVMA